MNSVRWWRTVKSEASSFQFMSGLTLLPNGSGRATPNPFGVVTPAPSGTTIILPQRSSATRQSVVVSGNSVTFSSSSSWSATPRLTWSNVSPETWAALGFWSGLGFFAFAALAFSLVLRRRFNAESPPRRILAAAIILFTLYAGYHAIMFAREVIS
jgi:hypothetical protein